MDKGKSTRNMPAQGSGGGTTKGIIWGATKVGKTSLLLTLPPEETLVLDLESGLKAVQGVNLDVEEVRTWGDARAMASYIGGPNPALPNSVDVPYSAAYYERAKKRYEDKYNLDKYKYLFIDSITVASRLAKLWASQQNHRILTEKGKVDVRKVYGVMAEELIDFFTQLQRIKTLNVWLVGILDSITSDSGEQLYLPQMEGSKATQALPGIFDEILCLTMMFGKDKEGREYSRRVFVTDRANPWGYPAGDRSGCLDLYEPGHLGKVTEKINSGRRKMQTFADEPIEMDEIVYLR